MPRLLDVNVTTAMSNAQITFFDKALLVFWIFDKIFGFEYVLNFLFWLQIPLIWFPTSKCCQIDSICSQVMFKGFFYRLILPYSRDNKHCFENKHVLKIIEVQTILFYE